MPVAMHRIGWEIAALLGGLLFLVGGIIAYSAWQVNVAFRDRRRRELERLSEWVKQIQ